MASMTVIGLQLFNPVETAHAYKVHVKESWIDDWEYYPEVELIRCTVGVGREVQSCEFRRHYGLVKSEWNTVYDERLTDNLMGYWVCVSVEHDDGDVPIWVGRVYDDSRDIFGAGEDIAGIPNVASGDQTWIAYGASYELRRRFVSEAYFETISDSGGDMEALCAMLPGVNIREKSAVLAGNRSSQKYPLPGRGIEEVFIYGNSSTWTRKQFVEYCLTAYMNGEEKPRWRLTGQADMIDALADAKKLKEIEETVLSIMDSLLEARLNIGWKIVPRFTNPATWWEYEEDDGFDIEVFSLTADDHSFGGFTVGRNPNQVNIVASESKDLEVQIDYTTAHVYERIRILGKRTIVCCTLWGNEYDDASGLFGQMLAYAPDVIHTGWTEAQETLYKAGTGDPNSPAEDHDKARESELLSTVFSTFVAPINWQWNGGLASPYMRGDGLVIPPPGSIGSGATTKSQWLSFQVGEFQQIERETLDWLPLRAGWDYTLFHPTGDASDPSYWMVTEECNLNPTGVQGELLKPSAWISWQEQQLGSGVSGGGLIECRLNKMTITPLKLEWGLKVEAKPAYLLGLGYCMYMAGGMADPMYGWGTLCCTIAMEGPQRPRLDWTADGIRQTPDEDVGGKEGSIIDIYVPEAECWYVAEGTCIGVYSWADLPSPPSTSDTDKIGKPKVVGPMLLRNDLPLLSMAMAGAIARYTVERGRCQVLMRRPRPVHGLVGHILTCVQEKNESDWAQAPITQITFTGGDKPSVLIKAGLT